MATVCSVKFPYAARDLWFDASDLEIHRGDAVICSTARGTERGIATGVPEKWDEERLDEELGGEALAPILRLSTDEDDVVADEREEQGKQALPVFQEAVQAHELPMKPVGVEYLFGLERVVCYFMSEGRVDFRALARDLSQRLDQRVDMHQLGAREQSAIMGGIAHCGQEFCCARLGQGFGTVTIRMAKDQDLPLSSPKISGACGRLMCCLRYENDAYREFKSRAPKKNARVQTPMGEARVTELDTPREAVTLRLENNKSFKVPIACMEASEQAREQAERNHSVCRPDCVSRKALEALDSAQVRLALAQLEAEEELENEDYLAPEDVLIDEHDKKSKRRRRARSAESPAEARGARGEDALEGGGAKRRHRKAAQGAQEGDAKGAEARGAEDEAASTKSRRSRRRRGRGRGKGEGKAQPAPEAQKNSEAQKADEAKATGEAPKKRSRRRRKKPAQPGEATAPHAPASSANAEGGSKEGQPKKPRRRRGRRGSKAPDAAQAKPDAAQPRPEGTRPPRTQEASQPTGAEGDKKPGRARRRHRRAASGGAASEG